MNRVLMAVFAAGAVLGGLDRILGGRLGLGERFEEGFRLLGPTALSMSGMICLAPVLADVLGRVVVPFYRLIGVDPAMFGSVLAIDMGGYPLAMALAEDVRLGRYAGIVVSSIFGCTVVFTIPVGMGMLEKTDRPCFARGVMAGLAAMPLGLAVGGLAMGLPILACLWQNVPVFLLSGLLLVGLRLRPEGMVRGFCVFAEVIRAVVTAGLVLGAVEFMTGVTVLPGMAPLTEAMETVSSIGIVLLGSLPVTEILKRLLHKPFRWLGEKLGLSAESVTGLLAGLVSPLPALSLYGRMEARGKVMNGAFLVSAASLLAAHTAFTASTEPSVLPALFLAKLTGGITAAALGLGLGRKD